MAWGGTLTRLTNVSGELILDEGRKDGYHKTGALDLDAKNGGGTCNRYVRISVVVEENPASTGEPRVEIEINIYDGSWQGWKEYTEGEYYCDQVNVRTTVYGNPELNQRPKIISQDIDAPPANSRPETGNIISVVTSNPGSPDYSDRHVNSTSETVIECVGAQTPTFRSSPLHEGMGWFNEDLALRQLYDENGNVVSCDPRKTARARQHMPGDAWNDKGVGTWDWVNDSSQDTAGVMYNSSGNNSDEISYYAGLRVGAYQVVFKTITDTNAGKIEIRLKATTTNVLILSADCYSGSTVYNVRFSDTFDVALAATYEIELKINGQNGSSSGFYARISYIDISPSASD